MAITRGEIKYEILTRLNKTATTKGFYSDDKINTVIQELVDYTSTEMFLADEGWNHSIDYVTIQPNTVTIPIAAHWAMIAEVRYLVGNVYIPLAYDQQWGTTQWAGSSGVVQSPDRYKIVNNMLYFNPAISIGGENYIQIEYFAYPRRFQKDTDFLESQFDRCMFWFVVNAACDMLPGQLNFQLDKLSTQAAMWYTRMKDIINMRTRQVIPIQDFDGY